MIGILESEENSAKIFKDNGSEFQAGDERSVSPMTHKQDRFFKMYTETETHCSVRVQLCSLPQQISLKFLTLKNENTDGSSKD